MPKRVDPARPNLPPRAPARPRRGRGRRLAAFDPRVLIVQLATAAGVVLTLSGVGLLVTERFQDLLPLFAITPPGILFLWFLSRRLVEPADMAFLRRVVVAGLLVRVGLALVAHYSLPVWFFAPDQLTYQDVGWRTLQYHQGLGPIPWQIQDTAELGYFYWNAFLYMIFGFAPLAPKLVNAFVGVGAAILCYRLAGELAGKGPAQLAALLTMFFPSMILWSTLNLRDPIVLFVTLLVFLGAVRLRVRPTARSLLMVVFGLSLLVLFRDYIAMMAVFGLVGATFLGKGRGIPANVFVSAVLFAIALLAYQQLDLGTRWVESASFEALAQQREFMAVGGTAFRPETDISTPLRGLQYMPIGLAFFLFSPFPWQTGSLLSLMTLPEQLLWYGLIPMVIAGGFYLVRHRFTAFGPILVFVGLTSSVYALVEGNAGTAYRHRAQVMVFFLIMAAVGLAVRSARKRGSAQPPAA